MMKPILLAALLTVLGTPAAAEVLYEQPSDPNGGFYHSSWWDPDGSNYDEYIWDRFVLASAAALDTVAWRGTYDPAYGGDSPVVDFTVGIYGSIPGGSEPDVAHPPFNAPGRDVPTGCYFTHATGDAAFALLTAAVSGAWDGQDPEFEITGPLPNPTSGDRLEISFRLPGAERAELALFDACGRRVAGRQVSGTGAMPQIVDLAAGTRIEPGVYFARLARRGGSRSVRLVVVR
jgi:hypothetical protein